MPDEYDRMRGLIDGLPGMTKTGLSTIEVLPFLGVGGSKTYFVQTFRQREEVPGKTDRDGKPRYISKDRIFLQIVGSEKPIRVVLPPQVCEAIARQRDGLTARARRRVAKEQAAARKAAGWKPTFGGKRGRRRSRKRKG